MATSPFWKMSKTTEEAKKQRLRQLENMKANLLTNMEKGPSKLDKTYALTNSSGEGFQPNDAIHNMRMNEYNPPA